jgi:hypothetical protein
MQKQIYFIVFARQTLLFEEKAVCAPLTSFYFNGTIYDVLRFCGRSTGADRGVCFCALLYSLAIQDSKKPPQNSGKTAGHPALHHALKHGIIIGRKTQ